MSDLRPLWLRSADIRSLLPYWQQGEPSRYEGWGSYLASYFSPTEWMNSGIEYIASKVLAGYLSSALK
jgi:hypothetical protein